MNERLGFVKIVKEKEARSGQTQNYGQIICDKIVLYRHDGKSAVCADCAEKTWSDAIQRFGGRR